MPRTAEEMEAPRRRAVRRRRKIFLGLVALAALTFVIGWVPDLRWILRLHIAIDFFLAGYVLFLIQAKQQRERYVPRHARPVEHVEEHEVEEVEEEQYLRAGAGQF